MGGAYPRYVSRVLHMASFPYPNQKKGAMLRAARWAGACCVRGGSVGSTNPRPSFLPCANGYELFYLAVLVPGVRLVVCGNARRHAVRSGVVGWVATPCRFLGRVFFFSAVGGLWGPLLHPPIRVPANAHAVMCAHHTMRMRM